MRVTVELQAYLVEQYSPDGKAEFECELEDGATVYSLIRRLNVPEEMASVIVINDRSGHWDDELHEGDKVILIPPLAGG
jgi:molybdopterin converting factor small subunit